ncbi:MAG: hypothetical protein HQK59_01530 [Deltaproteobacteria bacterium]|nr:hypothetical protein [Deltaproteobacteria bacterium]
MGLFVLSLSILKGLRAPNLWAANHYVLNYSEGLIRRGLFGTIGLMLFGDVFYKYRTLFVIAFGIMALWLIYLLLQSYKVSAKNSPFQMCILVFFASPAMVFFVHEVGFFDQFGFLVTIGFIFHCRTLKHNLLAVIIGLSGSLLAFVHEGLVFIYLPVMLLALVCQGYSDETAAPPSRRYKILLLISCLPAIISLILLAGKGPISSSQLERLVAQIGPHIDFGIRLDIFHILQRSGGNDLLLMLHSWTRASSWVELLVDLLILSPSLTFLIYYGIIFVNSIKKKINKPAIKIAFIISSLSPLSLNLLGWDTHRWDALVVVTTYSSLLVLLTYFEAQLTPEQTTRIVFLAIPVIFLGLSSEYFLCDDDHFKLYPFLDHLYYLSDVLGGRIKFPTFPTQ